VTAGPGLAIALEVGIAKAKEMANQLNVPLIPINHIEGHLLSPMARSKSRRVEEQESISFPALGLVVSGGHTELVLIKNIGEYEILAQTQDDALGEALDKAARMLGLGYPGGAILEKMAQNGNPKAYPLPLPMSRSADKYSFSYSGLKTALYRLISAKSSVLSTQDVYDLAATFQNRAFQHLERVIINTILSFNTPPFPSPKLGEGTKGRSTHLLVGGGVAANMELRKRLRKMGREFNLRVRFPYSLKLCGDNAAMICVAAALRLQVQGPLTRVQEIDRRPRWRVDEVK
jgi:N6-L-threonylcarbamoyladenine synthase